MRWSKLITFGVICTLSLSGCLNTTGSSSSGGKLVAGSARASGKTREQRRAELDKARGARLDKANQAASLCYNDLCGPRAMSISDIYEKAADSTAIVAEEYSKNVQGAVTSAFESEKTADEAFLKMLSEDQDKLSQTPLSESQIAFLKAYFVLSSDNTVFSQAEKTAVLRALDSHELVKKYESMTKDGQPSAANYFHVSSGLGSVSEGMKKELEEIERISKDLREKFKVKVVFVPSVLAERVRLGEALSTDEQMTLAERGLRAKKFEILALQKSELLAKLTLNETQLNSLVVKEEIQKKLSEKNSNLEQSQQTCAVEYYRTYNLLPTDKDLETFSVMSQDVREKILAEVKTDSEERKTVENVKFRTIMKRDRLAAVWSKAFEERKKDMLQAAQEIVEADAATARLISIVKSRSISKASCENLIDLKWRETVVSGGELFVSWPALKSVQAGVGLLANDLARSIVQGGKDEQFGKLRACMQKRRAGTVAELIGDQADSLATTVTLALSNKYPGQENTACLLASRNPAKMTAGDLYRAVQITIGSKLAVAESCKTLVKSVSPRGNEAACTR